VNNLFPCKVKDCDEPGQHQVTSGNEEEGRIGIFYLCAAHAQQMVDRINQDPTWEKK
jgi:hypothetical protein